MPVIFFFALGDHWFLARHFRRGPLQGTASQIASCVRCARWQEADNHQGTSLGVTWKRHFSPNSVLLGVLNAFLRCPPWCWMVCPPSRGLVSPCLPLSPIVSPHMCACVGCCVPLFGVYGGVISEKPIYLWVFAMSLAACDGLQGTRSSGARSMKLMPKNALDGDGSTEFVSKQQNEPWWQAGCIRFSNNVVGARTWRQNAAFWCFLLDLSRKL